MTVPTNVQPTAQEDTITPVTQSEPLEGEIIDAARPNHWHVFGGPLADSKGGSKNFPHFTYGPVSKAADDQLRAMTIAGEHGETFRYLGSFDHDPTDEDLRSLRPGAYK